MAGTSSGMSSALSSPTPSAANMSQLTASSSNRQRTRERLAALICAGHSDAIASSTVRQVPSGMTKGHRRTPCDRARGRPLLRPK